jgi:nitric oxide synthase oxygenase domain/subunit
LKATHSYGSQLSQCCSQAGALELVWRDFWRYGYTLDQRKVKTMDKFEEALRKKLEEKFDKSWINDHMIIIGPDADTKEEEADNAD